VHGDGSVFGMKLIGLRAGSTLVTPLGHALRMVNAPFPKSRQFLQL
jgi:hypothetical protein